MWAGMVYLRVGGQTDTGGDTHESASCSFFREMAPLGCEGDCWSYLNEGVCFDYDAMGTD